MKIVWKLNVDGQAEVKPEDRFYSWARVGFSDSDKYLVVVRIGLFIEGLLAAPSALTCQNEYVFSVECCIDLVVRRLPDGRLGVAMWGDYKTNRRTMSSEEVLVTEKQYHEMVVTFVNDISNNYLGHVDRDALRKKLASAFGCQVNGER